MFETWHVAYKNDVQHGHVTCENDTQHGHVAYKKDTNTVVFKSLFLS